MSGALGASGAASPGASVAALLREARAAASPAGAPVEKPPAPLATSCPARDPEDGICYPSADAADLAWLARSGGPASVARRGDAPEEDPDDPDDAEGTADGGAPASLDPVPNPSANPARLAFWQDLAKKLTGLVVHKANSRPASVSENELAELFSTDFPLPLEAFDRVKFRDTFLAGRGQHKKHHAIDLPAPRGTPVVAVMDGFIERLGRDRKGGKVVYLRDMAGKVTFFYAHLSRHEKGLKPGDRVTKGQRLGDVGATGHVIGGPHLHFAIFLDEDSAGRALVANPYLVFSPLLTP